MRADLRYGLAAALTLAATPAAAQQATAISVEAMTDDRRRGLSWTEGRAAVRGAAWIPVGDTIWIDVGASTARDAARHGGADVLVDAAIGLSRDVGAFRVGGSVTGHLFAGGTGPLSYVEVSGTGVFLYGPVQLDAAVRYAPDQRAIGGDNLYVSGRASAGVPGTPYSVAASVGRTMGDTDELLRAARLRPGGDYWDWSFGVERVLGRITIGVDYTGTDIGRGGTASRFADRAHAGDALVGRIRFGF